MISRSVKSSLIDGYTYDSGVLEIQFSDGRLYRYINVPESLIEALGEATSIGSFFNQYIKGKYPFNELRITR